MKVGMRHLVLLIAIGSLVGCAGKPLIVPSFEPTKAAIIGAQQHSQRTKDAIDEATIHSTTATTKIAQLERNLASQLVNLKLAQEVHMELEGLAIALLRANQENKLTQAALVTSQAELLKVKGQVGEQIAKANAAIERANRERVKYHRLKLAACTLIAAAVGFVVFHFSRFLIFLGPYVWAAIGGIPVIVWGALWFIL